MGRASAWSPVRDDVLRRRWPIGDSNQDIRDELNALDGPEIAEDSQLSWRAQYLQVRRPDWFLAETRRKNGIAGREKTSLTLRAISAASKPKKVKAPPKLPMKVPEREVLRHGFELWQEGLLLVSQRDDLDAINRAMKKRDPDHPGFRQAEPMWWVRHGSLYR